MSIGIADDGGTVLFATTEQLAMLAADEIVARHRADTVTVLGWGREMEDAITGLGGPDRIPHGEATVFTSIDSASRLMVACQTV